MDDFSEVGLDFAGFVGALLDETFEALLQAQHQQVQRYAELRAALDLSDADFAARHLPAGLLDDRAEALIGGWPVVGTALDDPLRTALARLLGDPALDGIVGEDGRLTADGLARIEDAIAARAVADRRAALAAVLGRAEQARLMVDSGEITARLHLSAVMEGGEASPAAPTDEAPIATPTTTRRKAASTVDAKPVAAEPLASAALVDDMRRAAEAMGGRLHVSEDGQAPTVIVDRATLAERPTASRSSTRIIARPLSVAERREGTLSSAITLHFRLV